MRSLALRLADIARERGLSDDQIPSHNTLRNVVERARREWRRRLDVGNELLLDQAACGISREDGAPWIVFVIADAASQLILGAAAGWAESVRRGYAEAAMDGARRICLLYTSEPIGRLPPLHRSARASVYEIFPGLGAARDHLQRP